MKVKLTSADVNFGEMIYCLYGKCEIRKGLLKSDNSIEICIKKVSLLSADEKVRKSLEFETMSRLNHENIINLISASIEEKNLYIFLEYFPEGDLSRLILSHINQKSPFSEQELFKFAYQLIDALSYMQENSISHRDLKPQNIFVCENSSKLKIGDFGCSRNAIAQTLTLAGTDIWLSPALRLCLSESFITGQRFTHHDPYKSDVYSLGLIFLYMASLIPIDNLAKIENLQYLINTRLDSLQIKYQDFTNLLRNMLKVDEPSREDFIALKSFLIYNYPKCPGCNIVFCINNFFRVGEDILCNECVTTFDPIPFKDL
jgi:serine/threonine protein kinase